MNMTQQVEVFVTLLEEGTDTIRPTKATVIRDGVYQLLASTDYDPEDEIWEFLPGTVVECKETYTDTGRPILLAVRQVGMK
jgi:hypothetical protein